MSIYDRNTDEYLEDLLGILQSIPLNKLVLLTGDNSSGKSLIRKQMGYYIKRLYPDMKYNPVIATSMEHRTGTFPSLSALSGMFRDMPCEATSMATYSNIKQIFNMASDTTGGKRYFIIDEPEIGLSKECQAGLCNYLKSVIPSVLENTYGIMIITHSELIVNSLKEDAEFIHLGKEMGVEEWLNRKIEPVDLEKVLSFSDSLYHSVLKREKERNI